MDPWFYVGCAAAGIGICSLIPEVIKAYRTHHLQDLSWGTLFMFLAGSILWGAYGIHAAEFPMVASASVNFVLNTALIVMKKVYAHKKRKLALHVTVLKPQREKVEA